MPNPQWPVDVPTAIIAGTLEDAPEANLSEFGPEVGPPIRRMRTSIATDLYTFQSRMTPTQWRALKAFWRTDCRNGALPFDRTSPVQHGVTSTFTFVSPPAGRWVGRTLYKVTVALRLMP